MQDVCTCEVKFFSRKRPLFSHESARGEYDAVTASGALIAMMILTSKNSVHHHRGTPALSLCPPAPRSQSEMPMVYRIYLESKGKGYTRSRKKGTSFLKQLIYALGSVPIT